MSAKLLFAATLLGVNFTNMCMHFLLHSKIPKARKHSWVIIAFLHFWDLCTDCKTLLKLTPGGGGGLSNLPSCYGPQEVSKMTSHLGVIYLLRNDVTMLSEILFLISYNNEVFSHSILLNNCHLFQVYKVTLRFCTWNPYISSFTYWFSQAY